MNQITIDLSDNSKFCEMFGIRPIPEGICEHFDCSHVDPKIKRIIKEVLKDKGFETDSI